MPLSCKILVKIGQVDSAENILIEIASLHRGSAYFVEYLWMYLTNFRNLFTISKRFMCRYVSVPIFFPICQGTLPWQPNIVAVIMAN